MRPTAQDAISKGAIRGIFNGSVGIDEKPVVQVLQVKTIPAQGNAPERYRVVLSDTDNFVQCMVATQANHMIASGKLKKGVLIRMLNFTPSTLKDRQIMVLLSMEVLDEYGENEKLGSPVSLDTAGANAPQNNAQAAPPTSFYGNKPSAPPAPRASAPSYAQQPQYGGKSSGGGGSSTNANIYPIEALSPFHGKWTIKARVSSKSDIKTWRNAKGEGKLFTVNFLDETGEIRATGFNEQCNELYDVLQEGQVYYVSKCHVKNANRKFSTLPNDFELTFDRSTEIVKCDDESSVPQVRYNFVPLADIINVEPNALIDIVAVLKEIGDCSEIISKSTQKPFSKRELTLVDSSMYTIRLTVWGTHAIQFDVPLDSVLVFKGVKVSDFGGRSLSALGSSAMLVNPDISEAHSLKGWWEGQGKMEHFSSHRGMGGGGSGREDFKTLQQVKEEQLGMGETPQYFSCKVTVSYVKQESAFYPSCPSDPEKKCNKKVIEMDDGSWRCENCDRSWPAPQYRYILLLSCYDAYDSAYLNCFDDVGRMVMGMSADELHRIQQTDTEAYPAVFQAAACKTFTFKCRAKMEIYQDQQRVRYQVMDGAPVNFVQWSHKFIEQIKLYD